MSEVDKYNEYWAENKRIMDRAYDNLMKMRELSGKKHLTMEEKVKLSKQI